MELLRELVKTHGEGKWKVLAEELGRSRQDVQDQWRQIGGRHADSKEIGVRGGLDAGAAHLHTRGVCRVSSAVWLLTRCLLRWTVCGVARCWTAGKWSEEEEERLRQLVQEQLDLKQQLQGGDDAGGGGGSVHRVRRGIRRHRPSFLDDEVAWVSAGRCAWG